MMLVQLSREMLTRRLYFTPNTAFTAAQDLLMASFSLCKKNQPIARAEIEAGASVYLT